MFDVRQIRALEVSPAAGLVSLTVEGESVEASAEFWRAVLFDCKVRDPLRALVSRDLTRPVTAGACWWNGDGR